MDEQIGESKGAGGKTQRFLTIIIASGICRGFVVADTKMPQG